MKLWDLASGKETKLRGHVNPITSLSFSPDGRLLVSGGNDNTARIWDVGARAELHHFSGGSTGVALFVANVRFSPDGTAIAFSSMTWKAEGAGRFTLAGSRLVIGDAASGAEIRSIAVHTPAFERAWPVANDVPRVAVVAQAQEHRLAHATRRRLRTWRDGVEVISAASSRRGVYCLGRL